MKVTAAFLSYFDRQTREAVYIVYVGRLCGRSIQELNLNSKRTRLLARIAVSHLPNADGLSTWSVHAALQRHRHPSQEKTQRVGGDPIARQFATSDAPLAPWYRG